MARWQSGYAADCKSVYGGSIPFRASIIRGFMRQPCIVGVSDAKIDEKVVFQKILLYSAFKKIVQ